MYTHDNMYSLCTHLLLLLYVLVLSCTTHTTVRAAPPHVVDQRLTFTSLDVSGMTLRAAVFSVWFDQDLYVSRLRVDLETQDVTTTTLDGEPQSYASLRGAAELGDRNYLPWTTAAAGVVRLACGDDSFARESWTVGNVDGPPNFLLLAPGTLEPAKSILLALGGQAYNETYDPTQFSAVFLYSMQSDSNPEQSVSFFASPDAFLECRPALHFPGLSSSDPNTQPFPAPAGRSLVNEHGEPVDQVAVVFTHQDPVPCTWDGIQQMEGDVAAILSEITAATSQESLNRVQFLGAALSASQSWNSCLDQIQALMVTQPQTLSLPPSTGCSAKYGTLDWATSPCCNQTLQATQCCQPRSHVALFSNIVGVTESAAQCHHPDITDPLLRTLAHTMQALQVVRLADTLSIGDGSNLWQTYAAFFQTCQTMIWAQPCTSDFQCRYSKSCDTSAHQCAVLTDQVAAQTAQCYVDQMPTDLLYELSSQWGVPYSSDSAQFVASFRQALAARVSLMDCVGPQAGPYRSSTQNFQNNTFQITPGDEEGCLSVAGCNDGSQASTRDACVGPEALWRRGESLCGTSNGNFGFQDHRRRPTCQYTQIQDQGACQEQVDGVWAESETRCYRNVSRPEDSSLCFTSSLCSNTSRSASASSPSPNNDQVWDQSCSMDTCLAPGVRTSDACSTLQQALSSNPSTQAFGFGVQWNRDVGACFASVPNNEHAMNQEQLLAYCQQGGGEETFQVARGVSWSQGRWDSESACRSDGVCSIPSLQQRPTTLQECQAHVECDQPCPQCQSNLWDNQGRMMGMCVDTVVDSETCSIHGGWWQGEQNQCAWNVPLNATCPTEFGRYEGCELVHTGGGGSEAACRAYRDTHPTWQIQCQWQPWAACSSADQCRTTAKCNDDDLAQWQCSGEGGCQQTSGACIQPWTSSSSNGNGQPNQCPNNNQNGPSQTRLGCVVPENSRETCLNHGGVWVPKATDQESCLAHGDACFSTSSSFGGGGFNQMTRQVCETCSGYAYQPIYQWTGGRVLQSRLLPTQWVPRAWTQINQWTATVNPALFQQSMNQAITSIQGRTTANEILQRYSLLMPLVKAVVQDCLDSSYAQTDSWVQSLSDRAVGQWCRLDPGDVLTRCGPLTFNGTFLASSAQVQLDLFLSGIYVSRRSAASSAGRRRRLLTQPSENAFEVVEDPTTGQIVGVVVGDGVSVPIPGNQTSVYVCLTRQYTIPVGTQFTVPDFGLVNTSSLVAQNASVTLTGSDFCATITTAGTYVPVLRLTNNSLNLSSSFQEQTLCGPGSYQNSTSGPSACLNCTAGRYQDAFNATTCFPCMPGRYSGAQQQTLCAPCQIDTFANTTGQSSCYTCVGGTYSPFMGSTSCLVSPPSASSSSSSTGGGSSGVVYESLSSSSSSSSSETPAASSSFWSNPDNLGAMIAAAVVGWIIIVTLFVLLWKWYVSPFVYTQV